MSDRKTLIRLLMIVTPNFNLAATMGFLDPFRAANYLQRRTLFQWSLVSEAGGACRASNGASLETQALSDVDSEPFDIVVVSSSWTPEHKANSRLHGPLRRRYKQGATIGGLDTGAFILASAGLLEGKRATVHYEHIDAFIELFPNVVCTEDICVFDGRVISCCGGVASADFALTILQGIFGDALANASARYIFKGSVRQPDTRQNAELAEPIGGTVPKAVKAAIDQMEQHLETPISIPEICEAVRVSQRQLDRLFSQYVKKTPSVYYRDIRLDRARGLVTQTEMPLSEVAHASGFKSHVHFSRAYKDRFGLTPSRDRIDGRVPFEFRAWPMFQKSF